MGTPQGFQIFIQSCSFEIEPGPRYEVNLRVFAIAYSKTPWDTAPWHTIFADTLFWFRDKNFRDTLFFKFFTNLKVHYFQKCVKTLFNLRFLS